MARHLRTAFVLLLGLHAMQAAATELQLQSPDGRNTVVFSLDEEGRPSWAVARDGSPVLAPSPLGVQLGGGRQLASGLRLAASRSSQADERYELVVGKARQGRDHYRQLELDLADGEGRVLGLVLRAYDDGIALRYRLPPPRNEPFLDVAGELTGFLFPRDYACHALNLGRFDTSHEGEYDPVQASRIRPHHLVDLPLVCATGQGRTTFAIAEAHLDRYAALYLAGRGDGRLGVEARLSPHPDLPGLAVRLAHDEVGAGSHTTPWRVLMLGDSPGALVESDIIPRLNPPTPITDTSWIRPGKAAWDWWSGGLAPGVEAPGMNTATIRRYIDHAAALGLEYMLIDDGWYVGSTGNGLYHAHADITRPVPGLELEDLVAYARERGIGIWLWAHWRALEPRLDEVFAHYARLGIKGVKVDFMDRDDQRMVAFYDRMMRASARHRLMLNLHGAYRPTGLQRTWPQYLTQEGVLGAEYNKWSRRITPSHNLTLPFTRMLLGPMDYTPGGFRNVMPGVFSISFRGPQVMGTRAHQLAMYVVYESPLQMVADSPDVYVLDPDDPASPLAPGADFLGLVPTRWDETRVLAGEIGQYIVVARRSGRDWYIGAMANEQARELELELDFLPAADYRGTLWSDGIDAADVRRQELRIDAGNRRLRLALASGGGAALRLEAMPLRVAGQP